MLDGGGGETEQHSNREEDPKSENKVGGGEQHAGGGEWAEQKRRSTKHLGAREPTRQPRGLNRLPDDSERRAEAERLPGLREQESDKQPDPRLDCHPSGCNRFERGREQPHEKAQTRHQSEQRQRPSRAETVRDDPARIRVDRTDDVLDGPEQADGERARPEHLHVLRDVAGRHLEPQAEREHRHREHQHVPPKREELSERVGDSRRLTLALVLVCPISLPVPLMSLSNPAGVRSLDCRSRAGSI